MSETTKPQLFACLRYRDPEAAIDFLTGLGFTERLVARDEHNPEVIVHAEFAWRDNGGVMFGGRRGDDTDAAFGRAVTNLVVAGPDEVDATLRRALEAGATQASEVMEPDYGGRSVAVLDPEGNTWNIDSYPGA